MDKHNNLVFIINFNPIHQQVAVSAEWWEMTWDAGCLQTAKFLCVHSAAYTTSPASAATHFHTSRLPTYDTLHTRTCVIRRTCSSYRDKCFAAAGPRLWNNLPAHLRQTDINFEQFKQQLKTFLFGRWEHGALWLLLNCAKSEHNRQYQNN